MIFLPGMTSGPWCHPKSSRLTAQHSPIIRGLHLPAPASPIRASLAKSSSTYLFRSVGHLDAELGVIFNLGTVYRRAGDIRGLGVLLERAEEIWSETAKAEALALVCIGRAVTAQLKGDSPTAVAELAAIPAGSLQGDWLAQVDMIRGTNLLLSRHVDESIRSLG